jgi:hypothetical protein
MVDWIATGLAGRRIRRGVRLSAVFALSAGCAAAGPRTAVEPRELDEAGSAPGITAVEDLGGIDIPAIGEVRPHGSDGVAVIGEALCIRGRQFGRQPTVSIGGRVAAVVSRTGDGGILVRVPVGTPVGRQKVAVSQEHGTGEYPIEVRRLGVLHAGDRLIWLELGAEGPRVRGSSALPGAQQVQVSSDARAAYVIDGRGVLTAFELAAAGTPAVASTQELGPAPVRALLGAGAAHRLLVLRERDALVLDTAFALRPHGDGAGALPPWLRGSRPLRAALSPDGTLLAVGFPERNRVALLRLDRLNANTPAPAEVNLAPEMRAPVLVDLAFAPDGSTVWALTGTNPANRSLGPLPTTVHALRVQGGQGPDPQLERARTVVIEAATAPAALSTGRALALASGAAIRLPPEKATIYVSARTRESDLPALFAVGPSDTATPVFTEQNAAAPGRPDVTPDGRWLVGPVVEVAGAVRLAAAPADGRPGVTTSKVVANLDRSPADRMAEVRLQP